MQKYVWAAILAAILAAGMSGAARGGEVARYTFDGALGTEDSVGTHNGVLEGARGGATVVDSLNAAHGKVLFVDNPTVAFYDSAQRMSVADAPDLQFTTQMTIAMWMNAMQPITDKTQSRLVTKRAFPPDYSLQISTGSKDLRTQTRSMADTQTPADVWTYDTWHHVAMVYDAAGDSTCTLYVDGVPQKTVPIGSALGTSAAGLTIGATPDNNYATAYAFHGYLDDARFFDTALTQAEIQALMALVEPPSTGHPGDANRDGLVNLEDFGLLKDNFGMTAGATWGQGDFNNDGVINLEDFGILKDHFGHSSGDTPIAAVPEPVTALAMLLAAPLLARRRR